MVPIHVPGVVEHEHHEFLAPFAHVRDDLEDSLWSRVCFVDNQQHPFSVAPFDAVNGLHYLPLLDSKASDVVLLISLGPLKNLLGIDDVPIEVLTGIRMLAAQKQAGNNSPDTAAHSLLRS